MINYISPKRFSNNNKTNMNSKQLKEQMDSINLPNREPQTPTTFGMFGSDEGKYQPSQFLPVGSNDVQFINSIEYLGKNVSFDTIVRALSKKLTEGTAKPQRAAAYSEYFTYLGKVLGNAVISLEAAKDERASYRADKAEFDAINETYREQLKYEQQLSTFDWKTIELEERQEHQSAELLEKNVQLQDELEEVKLNQGKLKSLLQKFIKFTNMEKPKGENK